jgi:hypothetical protein
MIHHMSPFPRVFYKNYPEAPVRPGLTITIAVEKQREK